MLCRCLFNVMNSHNIFRFSSYSIVNVVRIICRRILSRIVLLFRYFYAFPQCIDFVIYHTPDLLRSIFASMQDKIKQSFQLVIYCY